MLTKNIKKGFSLVELLVVITISAILSVTAYVALSGQTEKARNSRRQQDLSTIQSALEIYYIEMGSKYPSLLTDLTPKYMPKQSTDPASTESTTIKYEYIHNSNKKYQLGATLEDDSATYFVKAYVIGNSDSDLITGVKANDGTTACTVDSDAPGGDKTCIPYKL